MAARKTPEENSIDKENLENSGVELESSSQTESSSQADLKTSHSSETSLHNKAKITQTISPAEQSLNAHVGIEPDEPENTKNRSFSSEPFEFDESNNRVVTANAINDAATIQDEIGFEPYVNALSKMIVHKNTQTPLVIGLYGAWGSGKTSFMKQIDGAIKETSKNKTKTKRRKDLNRSIFFEAWQYQNTKNLSGALLFNILKTLEKNNFWKGFWFRLKNACSQFNIAALIWNAFLGWLVYYFIDHSKGWYYFAGLPLMGLFLNKELRELIKSLKIPMGIDISKLSKTTDDSIQTTALHDFKPELKRVIDSFVPKGGRLILYIDDLDRCTPSQVVSILETLNVLFDTDRCVFLLGIDKPKVVRAIETHYKTIADKTNQELSPHEKIYGEAFLEKIIQLAFVIPSLDNESLFRFTNSLIGELNTTDTKEENESSDFPAGVKQTDEDNQEDIEYDVQTAINLKESITFLLPVTPRAIKRFLNKFRFIYLLWASNKKIFSKIQPKILPAWLLLNDLFPGEFEFFRKRHSNDTLTFDDNKFNKLYPILDDFIKLNTHEKLKDGFDAFVESDYEAQGQYFKLVKNTRAVGWVKTQQKGFN